ncbi:hypothetical protein COU57_04520 [Candidatus Pacearchaeota archaeon CG10_big_fil_rev_8_21_14_0_10_32_14]|nr:MAG: hypothetical protein COU57_04520 [Candidatus Pacearchaeota archaeon CG10_big_fil_rev_8_21_14_0_10_32_14]
MSEETGTITLKKDTLWKAATFVFAALFVISLFTGGFGLKKDSPGTGNVVADTNPTVNNPTPSAVKVSVDDDAVEGKKDAKVTIVEFSDYECPFCKRNYDQSYVQLKKEYIDTGKVKYVLRDFPLSFHPQAQKAAEAAECAGELGGDDAYFKMHDKLFGEGVEGGVATFKTYAKTIGIDQKKFDTCLDSGKMAAEVAKDQADGTSYGVQGTPAFFVNGKLISGAQPYSVFKTAIDAELA